MIWNIKAYKCENNEFFKNEIVPKVEDLDMDVVEFKPLFDVLQQPKEQFPDDSSKNQQSLNELNQDH